MPTCTQMDLLEINLKIANAENEGRHDENRKFFEHLLAPSFAFLRANGQIVGREGYLESLADGGDRNVVPHPDSVDVLELGKRRALVTCLVTMTAQGQQRTFHNARLFVRVQDDSWRLLAWANEQV